MRTERKTAFRYFRHAGAWSLAALALLGCVKQKATASKSPEVLAAGIILKLPASVSFTNLYDVMPMPDGGYAFWGDFTASDGSAYYGQVLVTDRSLNARTSFGNQGVQQIPASAYSMGLGFSTATSGVFLPLAVEDSGGNYSLDASPFSITSSAASFLNGVSLPIDLSYVPADSLVASADSSFWLASNGTTSSGVQLKLDTSSPTAPPWSLSTSASFASGPLLASSGNFVYAFYSISTSPDGNGNFANTVSAASIALDGSVATSTQTVSTASVGLIALEGIVSSAAGAYIWGIGGSGAFLNHILLPSLTLDASYGSAGSANPNPTDATSGTQFSLEAAAVDAKGNLYGCGLAAVPNSGDFNTYLAVWRLSPAGQLDPTLGTAQMPFAPLQAAPVPANVSASCLRVRYVPGTGLLTVSSSSSADANPGTFTVNQIPVP